MSYLSIAACVEDRDMTGRIRSCYAQEGGEAGSIPSELFWTVATAVDVEGAYESALAANHPRPGADEAVVSDQMILSVVQPHVPTT